MLVFPYPMEHHASYDSLDCPKFYLNAQLRWWMGSDRWKHPLRGTDMMARTLWGLQLANLLRQQQVDILHVNLLRPDALMWILPAKQLGIKVIGHFRSQATSWIPPTAVQHCCDLILCVSEFSKSRLLTKGQHTETKALYDSINVDIFHTDTTVEEAKRKLGIPVDHYLLLSIGQLSRHKGHDHAIHAFAKVASRFPKSSLYIAGGGSSEDLNYLKEIVSTYPVLQHRVFFSERQVPNVVDVYRAADLVLSLTKVGEAFGLVPYEAALMGVPFIAPEFGAVKEFIQDGVNGLLVDTNNIDAIADKIQWAMEHPESCLAMNQKVRQVIQEQLTPSVMCRRLEKEYKFLMNSTI